MSIDLALLRRAQHGVGFLRLYRWAPPCLSFGRNEPAITRYDRSAIGMLGLDLVRRPTGGRAVWHDAELTYAVAAPLETFGTLRETYHIIHQTLAAALTDLGIAATLAPARGRSGAARPGAGACFASPVGGEIVVEGAKLVGSAQLREGTAFLQHGSILLNEGQDIVTRITRGHAPPVQATSLAQLGGPVDAETVGGAIGRTSCRRWGGEWTAEPSSPDPDGQRMFGDPSWTWRR